MDALTGYGSDDSSSDSDSATIQPAVAQNTSSTLISAAQIIDKENSKDEQTSNSLTGLLSGYTRSDEIENENEMDLQITTNNTHGDRNYHDTKKRKLSKNISNDDTPSIVNKNALKSTIDESKQQNDDDGSDGTMRKDPFKTSMMMHKMIIQTNLIH